MGLCSGLNYRSFYYLKKRTGKIPDRKVSTCSHHYKWVLWLIQINYYLVERSAKTNVSTWQLHLDNEKKKIILCVFYTSLIKQRVDIRSNLILTIYISKQSGIFAKAQTSKLDYFKCDLYFLFFPTIMWPYKVEYQLIRGLFLH